jgi:hypothetical protein
MAPIIIEPPGAALFSVAVPHPFSTGLYERLAHRHPRHAGVWHLPGEAEVVFGFRAMVLIMFVINGKHEATGYIDSRNFTVPMFVLAIMVIAGTRPILQWAARDIAYRVAPAVVARHRAVSGALDRRAYPRLLHYRAGGTDAGGTPDHIHGADGGRGLPSVMSVLA